MKFNQVSFSRVSGTHLQGYIEANFDDLVKVFGEPAYGDGSKVFNEWSLMFEDNTVATIYDWKESDAFVSVATPNYMWHIGGFTKDAVDRVNKALRENT